MPQVLSTVVGFFFLQLLLLLLRDFFNLSSFSFTHTPRFLFLYIFPPLSLSWLLTDLIFILSQLYITWLIVKYPLTINTTLSIQ